MDERPFPSYLPVYESSVTLSREARAVAALLNPEPLTDPAVTAALLASTATFDNGLPDNFDWKLKLTSNPIKTYVTATGNAYKVIPNGRIFGSRPLTYNDYDPLFEGKTSSYSQPMPEYRPNLARYYKRRYGGGRI